MISNVKSVSAGQAIVKLKKVAGAKGYQYMAATNKSFTDGAKSKTTNARTTIFGGLSGGKTYYVKARGYKKVKGKMYYSSWSKVKSVKTK